MDVVVVVDDVVVVVVVVVLVVVVVDWVVVVAGEVVEVLACVGSGTGASVEETTAVVVSVLIVSLPSESGRINLRPLSAATVWSHRAATRREFPACRSMM